MKLKILTSIILFTILSCCKHADFNADTEPTKDPLTKKEINTLIETSLEKTGDFIWSKQPAHVIWSALEQSENILSIGYGSNEDDFTKNASSDRVESDLVKIIGNLENLQTESGSKLKENNALNTINIKVTNKKTIDFLLKDDRVRYIEPIAYSYSNTEKDPKQPKGVGCGYTKSDIESKDYKNVIGAKVPWSFSAHKIPEAWLSSTGKGITVAIIDTGLSPEQKLLNDGFNKGHSSTDRTVKKYGTFVNSPLIWSKESDGVDDQCGHGTKMASVATAPLNKTNLPVGVAYDANLVTYRAVKNVLIDSYHEKKGVVNALIALADNKDVNIISMSIGSPFTIRSVSDAIKYAHSKGKMIICAGGTSSPYTKWFGVIFPAKMKETVAVTGVVENKHIRCDVCHYGSKIDFTIQMQRDDETKNKVPVLSYYNNAASYVGGSSVATATTAGIAALVWSKNPNWTRKQVLEKMRESSEFYPNKDRNFGYGNINAFKAVQD